MDYGVENTVIPGFAHKNGIWRLIHKFTFSQFISIGVGYVANLKTDSKELTDFQSIYCGIRQCRRYCANIPSSGD